MIPKEKHSTECDCQYKEGHAEKLADERNKWHR